MRAQPVEFLADVGSGGEKDGFLMQAVGIERRAPAKKRRNLLLKPCLDFKLGFSLEQQLLLYFELSKNYR